MKLDLSKSFNIKDYQSKDSWKCNSCKKENVTTYLIPAKEPKGSYVNLCKSCFSSMLGWVENKG